MLSLRDGWVSLLLRSHHSSASSTPRNWLLEDSTGTVHTYKSTHLAWNKTVSFSTQSSPCNSVWKWSSCWWFSFSLALITTENIVSPYYDHWRKLKKLTLTRCHTEPRETQTSSTLVTEYLPHNTTWMIVFRGDADTSPKHLLHVTTFSLSAISCLLLLKKKPKSLKQSTDREVLRWWRKAVLILFCFTSKLKDYIWYLQTDSEIKILIFMCIFSSVAALTAVIVSAHITQEPSWVRLPDIRYRNRLVQQIICLPWAGPLWSLQAPL